MDALIMGKNPWRGRGPAPRRSLLRVWCEHCERMVPCDEYGEALPHNCELYADRPAVRELNFDE